MRWVFLAVASLLFTWEPDSPKVEKEKCLGYRQMPLNWAARFLNVGNYYAPRHC